MQGTFRILAKTLTLAIAAALGTGMALADKPSSAGKGHGKDREQSERRYDHGDGSGPCEEKERLYATRPSQEMAAGRTPTPGRRVLRSAAQAGHRHRIPPSGVPLRARGERRPADRCRHRHGHRRDRGSRKAIAWTRDARLEARSGSESATRSIAPLNGCFGRRRPLLAGQGQSADTSTQEVRTRRGFLFPYTQTAKGYCLLPLPRITNPDVVPTKRTPLALSSNTKS
jgi:hypothetical protein